MEILNIIRILTEIIMFVFISTASVYFIVYIKKIKSGLTDISIKVNDMGNDIKPVLYDINIITGKLNKISDSITRISDNAENISGKILNKTEEAEIYIDAVRDSAAAKIKNILNMIHALNTGLRTFYKKIN